MYAQKAKDAYEEGFEKLAREFERVAKIEKTHDKRYLAMKKSLDNGEVFARTTEQVWVCTNCGHIHVGTKAPEICPVCAHPQAYFELRAITY